MGASFGARASLLSLLGLALLGGPVWALSFHVRSALRPALLPRSGAVLVQAGPSRLALHRLRDGALLRTFDFEGPHNVLGAPSFVVCPEERHLVLAGSEGLSVWCLPTGRQRWTKDGPWSLSNGPFCRRGRFLVAANRTTVVVFETSTGQERASVPDDAKRLGAWRGAALSPDGSQVALAGSGWVGTYDIASREVRCREWPGLSVEVEAYSADGRYLATSVSRQRRGAFLPERLFIVEVASLNGWAVPGLPPHRGVQADEKGGFRVLITGRDRQESHWYDPETRAVREWHRFGRGRWLGPDAAWCDRLGVGADTTLDSLTRIIDLRTGALLQTIDYRGPLPAPEPQPPPVSKRQWLGGLGLPSFSLSAFLESDLALPVVILSTLGLLGIVFACRYHRATAKGPPRPPTSLPTEGG